MGRNPLDISKNSIFDTDKVTDVIINLYDTGKYLKGIIEKNKIVKGQRP